MNIKKHSDVLVNTVVTHRHIEEKKAEDSGRSTVHTSSSGVKHGGGSKNFNSIIKNVPDMIKKRLRMQPLYVIIFLMRTSVSVQQTQQMNF